MAKYITEENLETFLSEIRSGKMVAGAHNDYKDEDQFGTGHGTIRLGYKYPENGYIDEIKTYSNSLKDIEEIPQHPGEAPAENASQEEKDIYNNKKQQYDDYMRLKDTLKSSYSDVRLEDGRAYVKIEDVVYNTDIPDDVETLNALGDIPKNTKVKDLKGKTYAQLFNDILFPTDNNITAKYVGVESFQISGIKDNITVKLGSNFLQFDKTVDLDSDGQLDACGKLNQGSWSAYNNGLTVIGKETSRIYKITEPDKTIENVSLGIINGAIEEQYKKCGNYTYNVTIFHNAGTDNPKNNKGNYIDLKKYPTIANAMAAGEQKASIKVNVTLPCWASGANGLEELNKLVPWDSVGKMEMSGTANNTSVTAGREFPNHTKDKPSQFEIPRKMSKMEVLNTLNNTWESPKDINLWVETSVEKEINKMPWTYYRYKYTGDNRGKVKIKIYF